MQIKQVAVVLAALSITAHVAAKPLEFPEPVKRLTTQIKYCLVSSHLPRLHYERIRCGILTDKRSYIQEDLKQLRATAGKDGLRYAAEALVLADQQGLKQAIAYLSAAHEVNRNPSVVGGTLSVLYHLDGQDDLAVTTAEGISKRFPEEKRALRVLSEIYTKRKEYEKAYKVLAVLYPLAPSDPYLLGDASLHLLIADVCKHLGHLTQRASYLELACWKQVDLELWLASFDALVNDRVDYYSAYIRAGELYRLFGDDVRVLKRAARALSWVSMPSAISLQMQVVEQQPTAENRELLAKYEAQNDAFFVRQSREQVLAEFEFSRHKKFIYQLKLRSSAHKLNHLSKDMEPDELLRQFFWHWKIRNKAEAIKLRHQIEAHPETQYQLKVANYFQLRKKYVDRANEEMKAAWSSFSTEVGLVSYLVRQQLETSTQTDWGLLAELVQKYLGVSGTNHQTLAVLGIRLMMGSQQDFILSDVAINRFLASHFQNPLGDLTWEHDSFSPFEVLSIVPFLAAKPLSEECLAAFMCQQLITSKSNPLFFRPMLQTGDDSMIHFFMNRLKTTSTMLPIQPPDKRDLSRELLITSANSLARLRQNREDLNDLVITDESKVCNGFFEFHNNSIPECKQQLEELRRHPKFSANPTLKSIYRIGCFVAFDESVVSISPEALSSQQEDDDSQKVINILLMLSSGDRKAAIESLEKLFVTEEWGLHIFEKNWLVRNHENLSNKEVAVMLWGIHITKWFATPSINENPWLLRLHPKNST